MNVGVGRTFLSAMRIQMQLIIIFGCLYLFGAHLASVDFGLFMSPFKYNEEQLFSLS